MIEIPDSYPALPGQDPDEIAEEHPMRALAMLVRRFLAEYPEESEMLLAAAEHDESAELRPGFAA